MAIVTNVPTNVTDSDASVFRSIYQYEPELRTSDFYEQIKKIKQIQATVLDAVPMGAPVPEYQSREPADLIKNKTGLCYDRSRTLDKLYQWANLETRHVYILFLSHPVTGERLSPLRAFFTFGTESHAVTEVKTARGWILVDSNEKWISLTRDGNPVPAGDVFERASEFETLPRAFNVPYVAIRGMYSRRGQFYRPYLPYPQLNWVDFWKWVIIDAM
jgi:hypothetical protein